MTASIDPDTLVLVAEDNDVNQRVVQAHLSRLGLQTAVAHGGREAIEMAAATEYAAILMDCVMPGMDGFQATREIRSAERGRRVPIIAMTVLTNAGDREHCLAAGMDDYLSKPLRRAELHAAIERWVLRARGGAGRQHKAGDTGADRRAHPADILDQAAIKQLREALTPEIRHEIVDIFDDQQLKCLSDINGAIARDDRDELRRVAHLLKGSSASLGAVKLRICCQGLEHMGRTHDPMASQEEITQLGVVAAETSLALRRWLVD
jgi:CheY-like chemotaxis protein/HPt (histidine-containing phosphotransfer) domain-containing protein